MNGRPLYAALAGALGTALIINLAIVLTARGTGSGVTDEEARLLAPPVIACLVLGVAAVVAIIVDRMRRR